MKRDNVRTLSGVRSVCVNGSRYQDRYLPHVFSFLERLEARGIRIVLRTRFATYLRDCGWRLPSGVGVAEAFPADVQCAISLGGDGTFIRTAQWVGDREIPIMGINTGHLGFLASCRIDEAERFAEELLSGQLRQECRTLLMLEGDGIPSGFYPYALNEIAITKEETSSMICIGTRVDNAHLADYLADGLIISTPAGSTAYNLSLGGPILQPSMDCIALTPIAPHSLTLRPIVLSGDSVIDCTTESRAEHYRVSADGRSFVLHRGSSLRIRRAPFRVRTLHRPGDNFAATLHNKLHWGAR